MIRSPNDLSFPSPDYCISFPGAALESMTLDLTVPGFGPLHVRVDITRGDPRLGTFSWSHLARRIVDDDVTEWIEIVGWRDAMLRPAILVALQHMADGITDRHGPLEPGWVKRKSAPHHWLMRRILDAREREQDASEWGQDLGSYINSALGWESTAQEVWAEEDKAAQHSPATAALKDWMAVLVEEGQARAQAYLDGIASVMLLAEGSGTS